MAPAPYKRVSSSNGGMGRAGGGGASAAGSITSAKAKQHVFKDESLRCVLSAETGVFTGTKIMATMGPSCHDVDTLAQMLDVGMVAARVDLTWGPLEFHRNSLKKLEEAMSRTYRLCATAIDTMGREVMVRSQDFQADEQGYPWVMGRREVAEGAKVIITARDNTSSDDIVLPIMYDKFTAMAQPGDTVYVARYLVSGAESSSLYLQVTEVTDTDVICVAQNSTVLEGLLTLFHVERSTGDNLSNAQNDLPLMCDWDKQCIQALGSEFEIDFINISYCRTAEDVREAHRFLQSVGMHNTKVIAKIETRQALLNFQAILAEADGIIISRGNLGLDVEPEKMALVQKTLIQACNLVGKPVIITRVVDTMVNTPRPTRAEATDVANAVLDGVDGILLGAETLRGKYPVDTVRTVASICRAAEAVFDHTSHYQYLIDAAWEAVEQHAETSLTPSTSEEGPLDSLASQMVANARNTDMPGRVEMRKRGSITNTLTAMAACGGAGSNNSLSGMYKSAEEHAIVKTPYLSKLESIASSAVRAADKVRASLIVVYTHTGQTAELVAKYRPPVPILTLVVPHLVVDSLKWKMEGRSCARQCLISRGLMPFMAAPFPDGEALLEDAVVAAARAGLVRPKDHIVVVQRVHDDFCVKIVAMNDAGSGIQRMDADY